MASSASPPHSAPSDTQSSVLESISALSTKFLSSSPHSAEHDSDCADLSVHHHIRIQLKEIPFFADIPDNKLTQLAIMFEFRRTEASEVICRQGDEANGFAIIVSGSVTVSAIGPGGHDIHLNTLNEGDWFGEIALTQDTLRTATLTSQTPCLLLFLSSVKFKQFLTDAPEIRESGLFESTITRRTANSLKSIPLFAFLGKSNRRPNPNVRQFHHHSQSNHSPTLSRINQSINEFDESKLNLLGELFRFQQFARNSVIFSEGDEADAFYIIQRGTVGVYAKKGENDEREVINTGEILRSTSLDKNLLGDYNYQYSGNDSDSENDSASVNSNQSSYDDNGDSDHSPSTDTRTHADAHTSHGNHGHGHSHRHKRSSTIGYGVLLTELTKNDWFGEIALFSHTRRTATVITRTPCQMLKLMSSDFQRFLAIVPEVKPAFDRVMTVRISQTLSNIPFFRAVKENRPWSKIGVFGALFQYEHFTAGERVIRENELNDKFYLVCDGCVEVSKKIDGPLCDPIVIERLTKHQWFNETSLIEVKPALATYQCLENCLFLTVTRDKFQRFISLAPEIVDDFSALLTFRTATMLKNLDFIVQNIREGDKPWSKLELLCSMFNYEYFNSGSVVFSAGDYGESTNKFYLIQRGSVVLTHHTHTHSHTAATNYSDGGNGSGGASERSSSSPTSPKSSAHKLSIQITPSSLSTSTLSGSETHNDGHGSSGPVTLRTGSYFNEVSLLRHCPRPYTIITREPCVCLTLTRAKFHQFLKVAPEIRSGLSAKFPHYVPDSPISGSDPVSPLRIDDDTDTSTTTASDSHSHSGSGGRHSEYNIFIQRVKEEQEFSQSHQLKQQQQQKLQSLSPKTISPSQTLRRSPSPPRSLSQSPKLVPASLKLDSGGGGNESRVDASDLSRDDSVNGTAAVRFHCDEID